MSFLPQNFTAALLRSLSTERSSHSHIPFGRSFNFQSTTEVICRDRKFDLCAERKIKSRHISTLIIGESFALASNQMLICDGFEYLKRPYCLRRLNSTLNSTKNNGGESRYAPKGEYRRYSGLVPDYTSTKTSYSVVYLIRGYFIILYRTFVCQLIFVVTRTLLTHLFCSNQAFCKSNALIEQFALNIPFVFCNVFRFKPKTLTFEYTINLIFSCSFSKYICHQIKDI